MEHEFNALVPIDDVEFQHSLEVLTICALLDEATSRPYALRKVLSSSSLTLFIVSFV
jgi:hypothetical protein